MSDCYSGKDGALSIGGSNVAMLTSWTVTQNAEVLARAGLVGSEVALIFYPDNADTGISFTGNAVVTSIENSAAIGDVQTVSLSFTGTGSLTTDLTPA